MGGGRSMVRAGGSSATTPACERIIYMSSAGWAIHQTRANARSESTQARTDVREGGVQISGTRSAFVVGAMIVHVRGLGVLLVAFVAAACGGQTKDGLRVLGDGAVECPAGEILRSSGCPGSPPAVPTCVKGDGCVIDPCTPPDDTMVDATSTLADASRVTWDTSSRAEGALMARAGSATAKVVNEVGQFAAID
jgi:hypothetical protein